jgi:predicted DNA-binding protein
MDAALDLTFEIQEKLNYLDDNKKRLVLEIIDNFLPDEDLTDEDLYLIELAEQEYANGETPDWADVEWK